MQNGLDNPGPFTIFLVFSAGLLTSLGPCSLSLLPITIAYIGGTEKNKKIIDIVGFLACDTQARRVAKTGVMQGEEASPKVVPMAKGAMNVGILSSIIFISGPFGNWNFKIPSKFKPIIIAIKATIEV